MAPPVRVTINGYLLAEAEPFTTLTAVQYRSLPRLGQSPSQMPSPATSQKGQWTQAALEAKALERERLRDKIRKGVAFCKSHHVKPKKAVKEYAEKEGFAGVEWHQIHNGLRGALKWLNGGRCEYDILTEIEGLRLEEWLLASAANAAPAQEQRGDGLHEVSDKIVQLLKARIVANRVKHDSVKCGAVPLTKAERRLVNEPGAKQWQCQLFDPLTIPGLLEPKVPAVTKRKRDQSRIEVSEGGSITLRRLKEKLEAKKAVAEAEAARIQHAKDAREAKKEAAKYAAEYLAMCYEQCADGCECEDPEECPVKGMKRCDHCGDIKRRKCSKPACKAALAPLMLTCVAEE